MFVIGGWRGPQIHRLGYHGTPQRTKESVRWAAPIMFGPRTPHGMPGQVLRTWGTRPIASDFLLRQGHPPGCRTAFRHLVSSVIMSLRQ
jgi:hypothetical protein